MTAAIIPDTAGEIAHGWNRAFLIGWTYRTGRRNVEEEIAIGRGVCGTAAAERRTVVVPDVSRFPGHITCDARSRSEIVVPVIDAKGDLIAVFDIDSDRLGAFDQEDAAGLETIMRWFFAQPRG